MTPSDSSDYARSLELADAHGQNEKLARALAEAREQLTALKEEVEKLTAPPSTYGVYLSPNDDGTVNVLAHGRKAKVNTHSSIVVSTLRPVFCFPQRTCVGMKRQPLQISMAVRIDFRLEPGAADERIVGRHTPVVSQSQNLSAMKGSVLRTIPIVALPDGHIKQALAANGNL